MYSKLISVIIPVYNTEKYLRKCLDSVINQTYKNLEIIIINDGSTDDSGLIIKEYVTIDNRIIAKEQNNKGLSVVRNIGVEIASGEYIVFVDSDDWIEPNLCEVALNRILENSADVALWSYYSDYETKSIKRNIFEDSILMPQKKILKNIIGPSDTLLNKPESIDSLSSACLKMYKTSIIKKNNIYFVDTNKIGTEDLLFNIEYFSHIGYAITIPKPLYHYRKTNVSSLSSTYRENLLNKWTLLFETIRKKIANNPDYEKALNNRIVFNTLGLGLNELSSTYSYKQKFINLKKIINSQMVITSCKNFSFKYLPIHWKLFYGAVKYRFTFLYFLLLMLIKKMI